MTRQALGTFCVLATVATLVAQTPSGWRVRLDRSTTASDPDASGDVQFVSAAGGFHAVTPAAAVFWEPARQAVGAYSLKAAFTLIRPSVHVNYYGLVFAGAELEGADQNYLYFMVAQDGTWILKRRNRGATQELSPKTPSDAVQKPDAGGRSTNALEIRVSADKIDFLVNGTLVDSRARTGRLVNTDGLYGIRINHLLDVQVDSFDLSTP